jgi:TRAP-type uncharacterized transport system substrate-binding protein
MQLKDRPAVGCLRLAQLLLLGLLALQALHAAAAEQFKLLSGSSEPAQLELAQAFAKRVGAQAGIRFKIVQTAGPADSLGRLRSDFGSGFSFLPADVAFAYFDAALRGHPAAAEWVSPLRVIAPAYEQVFYFIARRDSKLGSLRDIRDARINLGPRGSAAAISTATLYRQLFNAPIPEKNATFLEDDAALAKLVTDGTIDVVAIVAPQPAAVLTKMRPEARRFIKVLGADSTAPEGQAALRIYDLATLHAASYPNLLTEDVETFANQWYFVAFGRRLTDDPALLARIAGAWCRTGDRGTGGVQSDGRPAISDGLDLKPGWAYAPTALDALRRCRQLPAGAEASQCTTQDRLLGLCE